MHAKYTSIIESGQLQGKALAEAYEKRAALNLNLRKFQLVPPDIYQATALRGVPLTPEESAANARDYFLRGQAEMAMNDYYHASGSFGSAAYFERPKNAKYYRFGAYAQVLSAWHSPLVGGGGNYVGAMSSYMEAAALDPRFTKLSGSPVAQARAQYDHGVAFFKANQFVEAINSFSEAIRLDPEYLDALLGLGAAHFQTKQFAEAVYDFNVVLFLEPINMEAYLNLSLVFESAGDLGMAEEILKMLAPAGLANIGRPPVTLLARAYIPEESHAISDPAYRACAFYYRNRAFKTEYLNEATNQCALGYRLDPGNKQYARLALELRNKQIEDVTQAALAWGAAILFSAMNNSGSTTNSTSTPFRNNQADGAILGLSREKQSTQHCRFVKQGSFETLYDGRAFTGGPGTMWFCN